MSHSIKLILGKEQVNKFLAGTQFSKEEKKINEKKFIFETEVEMKAFIKGVNETVGWTECYVICN